MRMCMTPADHSPHGVSAAHPTGGCRGPARDDKGGERAAALHVFAKVNSYKKGTASGHIDDR